ncbi:MAG TPA: hypothetical protein VGY66_20065 [Gemmataceae bacterium]|nr:hypothetical protein [Gemmataceae bacterium]
MDIEADPFGKGFHTKLLRQAYLQSANQGGTINRDWEPLDDEAWARLDGLARNIEDDE